MMAGQAASNVPRQSVILMYHSLDDSGSVLATSPGTFEVQMRRLADEGVPVVPLSAIRETTGAIAITFDDGFRNFLDHGLPILSRLNFPATMFVVSGGCGKAHSWGDLPTGLPLLDWQELRSLPDLVEIGAHGATHADLTKVARDASAQEMQSSRAVIEDRLGRAVSALAYPYGRSNRGVRAEAQRHFRLACGTTLTYVDASADPMDLPRIDSFYLRRRFWFEQLMGSAGRAYIAVRRGLREMRQ